MTIPLSGLIGYTPGDLAGYDLHQLISMHRAAEALADRLGSIREDIAAAIREAGSGAEIKLLLHLDGALDDAIGDLGLKRLAATLAEAEAVLEADEQRRDYQDRLGVRTMNGRI